MNVPESYCHALEQGALPVTVAATAVLAPALPLPLPTPHAGRVRRDGGKIQLEFVRVAVFHRHRGPHPDVRPLPLIVVKKSLGIMERNIARKQTRGQ